MSCVPPVVKELSLCFGHIVPAVLIDSLLTFSSPLVVFLSPFGRTIFSRVWRVGDNVYPELCRYSYLTPFEQSASSLFSFFRTTIKLT